VKVTMFKKDSTPIELILFIGAYFPFFNFHQLSSCKFVSFTYCKFGLNDSKLFYILILKILLPHHHRILTACLVFSELSNNNDNIPMNPLYQKTSNTINFLRMNDSVYNAICNTLLYDLGQKITTIFFE
jgi:hypothetical protein